MKTKYNFSGKAQRTYSCMINSKARSRDLAASIASLKLLCQFTSTHTDKTCGLAQKPASFALKYLWTEPTFRVWWRASFRMQHELVLPRSLWTHPRRSAKLSEFCWQWRKEWVFPHPNHVPLILARQALSFQSIYYRRTASRVCDRTYRDYDNICNACFAHV